MNAPDEKALSAENLFTEREEAFHLVEVVTTASAPAGEKDKSLARLRAIFDNYLECPSILDHSVGEFISNLIKPAREFMTDNPNESSDGFRIDHCYHSFSAIYALSKVRGRKTIQRLLPHEVKDVEPVLTALQQLSHKARNQSDSFNTQQPQRWESLYVLWNWMGTLSLVPFDSSVVLDSSASMIFTLIDLGKKALSEAGPTREAAASCLAKWLSRPDLENTELPTFVVWSSEILHTCTSGTKHPQSSFLILGVLQTLTTILKASTGARESLLQKMEPLWESFILLSESNICENNLLLRKFMVKWWSRMGCLYLPPRLASWRYQRGRRSLEQNLKKYDNTGESPVENMTSFISTDQLECNQTQHEDELFQVSDSVEDAMGFVLHALRDSSTIVRWPAAKGVGRLTERLPSVCADDVLDSVLELFVDPGADQAWHGGCLALAELARRGLLLPHRLSEVVPQVVRAIQYDVRRGQASVGAHVRDAACYTYWSFARAYHPDVIKPYVPVLSESIILTCLFDREINCRRAASAAFQECVGRQGAGNFKHGISILTAADYYAVGNRANAFTKISLHVAQYQEYRRNIIDHVYTVKLEHWDECIRILASKSLHGLVTMDKAYIVEIVLPSLLKTSLDPKNIPVRHGSILGLAEAIRALGELNEKIENIVPQNLLQQIAELVPTIEKLRLYRGRGGEMVRGAVCRFIECLCEAKIPLIARQQVRLLDSIDACLPHPNEDVQGKACEALRALTCHYFPVGPDGPSERLQKRVVGKYSTTVKTSENPAATRGFTLALGYLPKKLLAPSQAVLDLVLSTLSKASHHSATVGNEKDAETRRNAFIAMSRVSLTVGLDGTRRSLTRADDSRFGLGAEAVSSIFAAFFAGLEDYNVDKRRGDVGSWCRIEAMKGLEAIARLVLGQANPEARALLFSKDISRRLIGGLLKQFSEKLDSVRVEAGGCLERLLFCQDFEVPFIEQREYLRQCFQAKQGKKGETNVVNWADASLTFPVATKAAKLDWYFAPIVSGMIISVGGLTESVTKESTAAFLQLVKEAKGTQRIFDLSQVLLDLFQTHARDGRVTLPLLKAIDILLSHQCLDELIDSENYGFKKTLVSCITKEAKHCRDIHRHFACIDVALGLVRPSANDKEDEALAFVCTQLLHRFPRVRRYAAEHLYVCLLEQLDRLLVKGQENFALERILEFAWDGEHISIHECHEMAQEIAVAVDVSLPKISLSNSLKPSQRDVKDEFASYSALVDNIAKS